MSPRWSERAWKGLLFGLLLAVTWLMLTPVPPQVGPSFSWADKLQHAALFAALALLSGRAYPSHPRWGIAAALVLYGLSVEIAQPRTGRSFDAWDVAADALGSLAVWLVPRQGQPSSRPPPSARP